MALLKSTPEIEIWAEPLANIPRKTIDSFVVADLLADLMGMSTNTGGIYVRGATGNNWSDWVNIGPNLTVSNVGFMRFGTDGRIVTDTGRAAAVLGKGAQGGFYALPVNVPRDNITAGSTLTGGNTTLQWTSAQGVWKSVRAISSRFGGSGVGLYAVDGNASIKSTSIPANTSLKGSIESLGIGSTTNTREENRLIFGNQRRYSLNLKQGMKATIERWGKKPDNSMGWLVIKAFDDERDVNLLGGEYHFNLSFRGGRLVYDLNGARGWVGDTDQNGGFVPISWDAAPLQFTTINSRARLDISFDEHTQANGTPITGTVARKVNFNGPTRPSETLLTPLTGGYKVGGDITTTAAADGQSVTYTSTLVPDSTGTLTPIMAQMLLAYAPVWAAGAGSAPINLTTALVSADVELGHPPAQDGGRATVTLDGAMLEKIAGGWGVVQDFCPITVRGRWKSDTATAGVWANFFKGYMHGVSNNVNGWNSKQISVPCWDESLRLRDPAAVVKDNFYPLDLLLTNKNSQTNLLNAAILALLAGFPAGSQVRGISSDPFTGQLIAQVIGPDGEYLARVPLGSVAAGASGLYGGECVQAILGIAGSPALANLLNGDGDPLRFFPASHLPIVPGANVSGSYLALSAAFGESLQSGSLSGKFLLPPPYGSDARNWIGKFEDDENGDFFFARMYRNQVTGDTSVTGGAPYPVYGQYPQFLAANALRWQLDEKAIPSNLERYLASFSNQTKPEKNYNEVLVLADIEGSDSSGLGAALRMGMARLRSDNPNAALYSWARTLVVRSNYAISEGAAEVLAYNILRSLSAVTAVWPKYELKGEGFLQPGDLVWSENLDHTNPSIEGVNFRVQKVNHNINIQPDGAGTEWTTTASCQPLSRTELTTLYGQGVPVLASYYLELF